MTAGRHGKGTRIYVDSVEVGSVLSIDRDDATRSIIDTTTYTTGSPDLGGPAYREFIGGDIVDGGAFTLELLLNPDTPLKFGSGVPVPVVVVFRPVGQQLKGAEWSCKCVLESLGSALPMDEKMTQRARFKISGPMLITPGSDTVTAAPGA